MHQVSAGDDGHATLLPRFRDDGSERARGSPRCDEQSADPDRRRKGQKVLGQLRNSIREAFRRLRQVSAV